MDLPVRGRRITGKERNKLEVAALKQKRYCVLSRDSFSCAAGPGLFAPAPPPQCAPGKAQTAAATCSQRTFCVCAQLSHFITVVSEFINRFSSNFLWSMLTHSN
jgi:hypothetical protein